MELPKWELDLKSVELPKVELPKIDLFDFDRAGPRVELRPVREFALRAAREILQQAKLHHGFWFNEMQPGHSTTLHSHEELDELLSAVYYINSPPDSGRLILHDDEARISVTPRPGLLVLFPPDLPHEVEENRSDRVRLSIAFNFGPSNSAT